MNFLTETTQHLLFPHQWFVDKIKADQKKHGLLPGQDLGQRMLDQYPGKPVMFTSVTNGDPPSKGVVAPHPGVFNNKPVTVVPLQPTQLVHMEERGRVITDPKNDQGNMSQCPFLNLTWKLHKNPQHMFYVLWDITVRSVKWVVWNFEEFYRLMTHAPIVEHWYNLQSEVDRVVWLSEVVWRGIIVALTTWGIINISPLLLMLTEWFGLLGSLLRSSFGLVGKVLSDTLYVVERLYQEIRSLLTSLF
jgi:hypothetical protein